MITDDAVEVHFGLRLLDRAADHACRHKYLGVNQARDLRHMQQCCRTKLLEQLSQRREVDEVRLCGSSLPIEPIELPALEPARAEKNYT